MTTRQTLRNYLSDVGLSSANMISYNIDPESGGSSSSDSAVDEGDDLGIDPNTGIPIIGFDSTSTEHGGPLAGGYVAYVTEANTFALRSGAEQAVSSIRGNQLTPAEDQGAKDVFATRTSAGLSKSDSGYYPSIGLQLSDVVQKNGSEVGLSGHDLLLKTIASPDDPESIDQTSAVKGTFAFLKEYNKYSQSELYTVDNSLPIDSKEYELNTKYNFQTAAGKYKIPVTEISNEISYEQIKSTGTSLLLKAAGWDTSTIAIESIDPKTLLVSRLDTENTDILSKFPESSTKSNPDSPRARDAFGFPTDPNGYSILEGNGDVLQKDVSDSKYMLSNGVAYTSETPFVNYKGNDNETKVMAYQAAISIIGLAGLLEGALIDKKGYHEEIGITTAVNAESIPTLLTRGPYVIGSSLKSSVTVKNRAIIKSIFIPTGIFQYSACVREGLYHYFGIKEIDPDRSTNTSDIVTNFSKNLENIVNSVSGDHLSLSYGFWHAVSRSAINIIKSFENATATVNAAKTSMLILQLKESKITRIMNVFATIGYQILVVNQVSVIDNLKAAQKPFDLDNMMTSPASRVMKSRDGQGPSPLSLVWRNSCLPSSFILSHEALSAMLDMDYTLSKELGGNPVKGMYGSTLQNKTYVTTSKGRSSIPSPVAKRLEARLGAEYVPFYFRDLRTNEVIAFHAFLESLTDGFTAQYAETKSYGRADSIKNYSSTNRSIGLSFWVVSTSKEDFNEMWYKINKLVTFVYPSYTAGREVSITNKPFEMGNFLPETVSFEQPFSQVVGGTPVIRMRVGDLIKSNYSRSNMARVMGVGGENFKVKNDITEGLTGLISKKLLNTIKDIASFTDVRLAPFLAIAGSPMELEFYGDILARGYITNATGVAAASAAISTGFDLLSTFLENGFVNPLLNLHGIGSSFGNGEWIKNKLEEIKGSEPAGGPENIANVSDLVVTDPMFGLFGLLKPNINSYIFEDDNKNSYPIRLNRAVNVKLIDFKEDKTVGIKITDTAVMSQKVGTEENISLGDLYCRVRTDDIMIDPFTIIDPLGYPGATLMIGLATQAIGTGITVGSDALANAAASAGIPFDTSLLGDIAGAAGRRLTSPLYNPIVDAIERNMGEGLAGVCKSITFGWMEAPWEIDVGSRAPMACKVTLSFDPIHDISPGIDVNGFNRAPVYKVGDIMHNTFGSPMSDGGAAERLFYKKSGVDMNHPNKIDNFTKGG